MDNATMGNILKTYRKRHKFSQEEFAKQLGYASSGSISKIESGEMSVSDIALQKLAEYHNTPIKELLCLSDYEYKKIVDKKTWQKHKTQINMKVPVYVKGMIDTRSEKRNISKAEALSELVEDGSKIDEDKRLKKYQDAIVESIEQHLDNRYFYDMKNIMHTVRVLDENIEVILRIINNILNCKYSNIPYISMDENFHRSLYLARKEVRKYIQDQINEAKTRKKEKKNNLVD